MAKAGGFVGNLTKLGGKSKKLALKSDMKEHNMPHPSKHTGSKQAHKKV